MKDWYKNFDKKLKNEIDSIVCKCLACTNHKNLLISIRKEIKTQFKDK